MAHKQTTILLLCVATVYSATITNISRELQNAPSSANSSISKNYLSISSEEDIEYDSQTPNFIVTEENPANGFQIAKSVVEGLISALRILRHMDLSEQGLKSVSLLVSQMLTMFAGQYFDMLKKILPVISGMAMAILESLR